MPSIINATTTTGVAVTGDTSGALALQTNNGTTAVTIDTSQRVGIGTSSPATKLQVAGTSRIDGNLEFNANPFVYSWSGGTTGQVRSGIQLDGTNTLMSFYTATNERMRIDSSGNLLFNSGYGSVATAYGCRAWVNFDGTGTPAIRASANVSSITDNGTGAYAVNFTTAMPDANYGANISVSGNPGLSDANFCTTDMNGGSRANPTTTAFSFTAYRFQAPAIDVEFARVSIFR